MRNYAFFVLYFNKKDKLGDNNGEKIKKVRGNKRNGKKIKYKLRRNRFKCIK